MKKDISNRYACSKIAANVDAMASKGLRANHLSSYTEIEAGDELRKPLKPLLAIACVGRWHYLILLYFEVILK